MMPQDPVYDASVISHYYHNSHDRRMLSCISLEKMQPRLPTPETDGLSTDASRRFVLIPVSEQVENQEPCEVDGINSRPTSEVESGNDEELVEEFVTRDRAYSSVSQFTQSDLSRLGMLTAIADAGKCFWFSLQLIPCVVLCV